MKNQTPYPADDAQAREAAEFSYLDKVALPLAKEAADAAYSEALRQGLSENEAVEPYDRLRNAFVGVLMATQWMDIPGEQCSCARRGAIARTISQLAHLEFSDGDTTTANEVANEVFEVIWEELKDHSHEEVL